METRRNAARSLLLALAVALGSAGCGGNEPAPATAPRPERVGIGYGTRDADAVTGAIGTVTRAELDRDRSMRLVDVLETRVPGVRVVRRADGDLSVRIRGADPDQSGEPLIVVDGSPVLSNRTLSVLDNLNPLMVERIDVLKDAGSTAAYGIRGANGVILITTTRGR